eukprot:CAMPEP_0119551170 /NCGR_PEP_ID=MMETSP1352-20130426/4497_1 /TAXON_ID=265584 /ORGANISM="Stauroneis constricta, Strain CCMP1120" /LENGTH=308 /DNA_ID=CAMNT_0007597179 /DNA_START=80 /DNA_END=1002 /DNA_ORIENTATION=+
MTNDRSLLGMFLSSVLDEHDVRFDDGHHNGADNDNDNGSNEVVNKQPDVVDATGDNKHGNETGRPATASLRKARRKTRASQHPPKRRASYTIVVDNAKSHHHGHRGFRTSGSTQSLHGDDGKCDSQHTATSTASSSSTSSLASVPLSTSATSPCCIVAVNSSKAHHVAKPNNLCAYNNGQADSSFNATKGGDDGMDSIVGGVSSSTSSGSTTSGTATSSAHSSTCLGGGDVRTPPCTCASRENNSTKQDGMATKEATAVSTPSMTNKNQQYPRRQRQTTPRRDNKQMEQLVDVLHNVLELCQEVVTAS